ncbi:OmpA family protein [Flaviramulus sp. BrNp1-15]|uniref:OmpA family protein n=1 Tax=Flaviramulus sp. BrNp1-15 TaxID=2916754 RepID=UPI001EE7DE72|nr:OmpA family protein [Flaviramulus sp. BrNp1-15]ULC58954.1 OmpA family protein [Flaviramulus sp. BrNp1-15]
MKIKHIFILFISIVSINCYAQKGSISRGAESYNDFSYVKTTDILLDVANNGYKSVDLFQKLGNSFYFNNKMDDAVKWYGELMSLDEVKQNNIIDPEYYYRYAQALKAKENYEESDKWMKKFSASVENDKRAKVFESSPNYLEGIGLNSEDIEIVNLPFNTKHSDFGVSILENQLVFSSAQGKGKNYIWNNQPFLELYSVLKKEDGSYDGLKKFNENVNTRYHESSVAFSPDGNTMYFTRNNFFKNRLKRDKSGVNRLQLYRAKKVDNSWQDIKPVHFNSESYSVAHPTINAKGDKLIFASDMPGSSGSSDLYITVINSDGTLGTPQNLGLSINTEAQETFPFINANGDLYFSSNGYPGLGGLDIYRIKDFENKLKNNEDYNLENIGKPINSSLDDFAYYEDLKTKEGYFSSNRKGGKGDDDIYWFKLPECAQQLTGVITDAKTNQLLNGAKASLFDDKGSIVDEQILGEDATYNFNSLSCDREYLVRVSNESYETLEQRVLSTSDRKEKLVLNVTLQKEEVIITKGTNLKDAINLNPIYFDLDKSFIRSDAEVELQKIISVLRKYPNMIIDVRSHTDSRATKNYNKELSQKRNITTINYLVKKGNINANRISGKGYGESELLNKCFDGVKCSEEEHQLNRRSDFIIVKM